MNKSAVAIVVAAVLVILVTGGIYFASRRSLTSTKGIPTPKVVNVEEKAAGTTFEQEQFENIKSAHYVSSDPANNALLTAPASKVTLNFNFDLVSPSKIQVSRDGTDVTGGPIQISNDKLSMSVPVNAQATGNYKVTYTSCWPDGSCHNGSFGFSVKLP